jgi:hypothetical protein
MAILIGTDEAGYGPNFGPLVISATRWYVPDALFEADLYEVLADAVSIGPRDPLVAIADSKALYKPGGGLGKLERGVLAALEVTGHTAQRWRQAWEILAPAAVPDLDALPWYADFERPLPIDSELTTIRVASRLLSESLQANGVELQRIESLAIFPDRFNRLVAKHGTKGGALSACTLELFDRLAAPCEDAKILVHCDKHGGRNRYGPLLQNQFPEYLIEVVHESRPSSVYRWGPRGRRFECRFVAKGESFLPAALASMASKYLREMAMRAFNAFWTGHVPELKPTAGYPVDAARFRLQIRDVQAELGIADQVLWRNR